VLCAQDLFRRLSNLLYNHHLITRYHHSKEAEVNEDIRTALVQDRRDFWRYLQEKILKFFQMTTEMITQLTVRELFDFLALCNKFLEIGQEFSS